MAPDNENLDTTLNQLRQQLAAARQLDPDVAARLRQTLADIQDLLQQTASGEAEPAAGAVSDTEDEGDDEPALTERLHEAARHFEESHPTISLTLGRLIDGLGQMGI